MRTIPTLFSIFSALLAGTALLQAQPPLSSGRELPRSEWRVYPSQEAATAAAFEGNSFLRPIAEWSTTDEGFSASFTVPFSWINRQVLFHIDEATAAYELRINGKSVGANSDPALPAEFNITKWVREGSNRLEIRLRPAAETAPVESWRNSAQPAVGRAWIMTQPTLCVRDAVVRTILSDNNIATAEIGLAVKSNALNPRTSRIHYELLDSVGRRLTGGTQEITLDMRREDTVRFLAALPDTLLWRPEQPVHCTLRVKTQHEGRFVEYIERPVGFRAIGVDPKGNLLLNGETVALRAASVSPQVSAEAIASLREQGYNTLKLQAGPVRAGLYDDCDRLGMLVVAQAPVNTRNSGPSRKKGGNPSNDPAWRAYFIERAVDSYHTAKQHPSVVAFSLAEDSSNGICLYESYLTVKPMKNETRPFLNRDGGNEWNNDPLQIEIN